VQIQRQQRKTVQTGDNHTNHKTYIFTNRNDLKVDLCNKAQLLKMLIAENSDILDTGAKFEIKSPFSKSNIPAN
jgi:hypothetical protein